MNFHTLLKALAGLLAAAGLVAVVWCLCLMASGYGLLIGLGSFAGMVVLACLEARKFKDTAGECGAVVYTDYYDVLKCLSVAVVPVLVFFLGASFGQAESVLICISLYALLMLLHIAYRTAQDNSFLMLPVLLLVKICLSVIWVAAFYRMLNPSGKSRESRRGDRAKSVMAMMMITPLISFLVLGDEGKELVQGRLRGRRFSGAGTLRRML